MYHKGFIVVDTLAFTYIPFKAYKHIRLNKRSEMYV